MNKKIFYAIKIMLIHLMGWALCALQAYFSMYKYKEDTISSACIRCSYNEDVLIYSIFSYLFFLIFYFSFFLFTYFLSKAKNVKGYKMIPIMIIYVLACLTVNQIIFVDRVTSWSTYTKIGELMGGVSIEIIVTAIIFYYSIKIFDRKYKLFDYD
jgi:hypothetical protein